MLEKSSPNIESFKRDDESLEDLLIFESYLKKWDIPYFLTNGTLLGCIRNQKFIEWDIDIDLDTSQHLIRNEYINLIQALKREKFSGVLTYTRNYPKITCRRKGRPISFGGFKENKNYFERSKYRYPKDFFEVPNFSGRKGFLYGYQFLVPLRSEDYLTWIYGNWREEIKSEDEDVYSTGKHYIKPVFIRKIRTIKYGISARIRSRIF